MVSTKYTIRVGLISLPNATPSLITVYNCCIILEHQFLIINLMLSLIKFGYLINQFQKSNFSNKLCVSKLLKSINRMAEWKVPELSSFCFHFIVSLVGNQWVVCYFFSHRDRTICNKNSFYASEHMGIDVAFSSFPPHAGSKWDELISEKIHSDIPEYVRSKLWQINKSFFSKPKIIKIW